MIIILCLFVVASFLLLSNIPPVCQENTNGVVPVVNRYWLLVFLQSLSSRGPHVCDPVQMGTVLPWFCDKF